MTLPSGEVWIQFPLVAVIVACFVLAFTGIFYFTRWIWAQYKVMRAEDLAWREKQSQTRDDAAAEQNRLWRAAVAERDLRWESLDEKKQVQLQDMARMMSHMIEMLGDHDEQAKHILEITERIEQKTQPRPGVPRR